MCRKSQFTGVIERALMSKHSADIFYKRLQGSFTETPAAIHYNV